MCFLRSMGASNIKRVFGKLNDRVITFGTTKNINRTRQDIEKKILEQKPRIVLLPDNNIKRYWNVQMILLLGYVATWVPFEICYLQDDPGAALGTSDFISIFIDSLFFIDIIINFLSAYEDPVTGLPIISLKKIAINYLTGWFILDLLAVIPIQLLESAFSGGGQQVKLTRLARLPRLYRLMRILRMVKMLRIFRKSSQFKDWMNTLNISVGLIRMLNVLAIMFFLVHLMACFWFMAASFEDNMYNTWVGGRGLVDADPGY